MSLENMLKLAGALSVPLNEVIRAMEANLGVVACRIRGPSARLLTRLARDDELVHAKKE